MQTFKKRIIKLNSIRICILVIALIVTSTNTFAQNTIKGKVIYTESKEPAAGVNINIKNSSIQTISDADGSFNLNTSLSGNQIVQFSLANYVTS